MGDARGFFEQALEASRDAERCGRQLRALEDRAGALGAQGFEPRTRSTPEHDRMGRRVAQLVDMEGELERRMEEDYRLIDLACRVLYGTDSDAGLAVLVPAWWADVLWWRYLDGASWERVGEAVGYSERRCQEVAEAALDTCDAWGLVAVAEGRGCAEG